MCPPHRASNEHAPLEDCLQLSIQIYPIFYPQSQHGRIKSWVRGSSGVWPAITYAPVIWLYWLWAACCATLMGLGNIKLIIAIDRQSICQCVELGGWADGLFASLPLPTLRHLCSQLPAGLAPGNRWEPYVYSSSYISMGDAVYTLDVQLSLFAIYSPQISFCWEKTAIEIQRTAVRSTSWIK